MQKEVRVDIPELRKLPPDTLELLLSAGFLPQPPRYIKVKGRDSYRQVEFNFAHPDGMQDSILRYDPLSNLFDLRWAKVYPSSANVKHASNMVSIESGTRIFKHLAASVVEAGCTMKDTAYALWICLVANDSIDQTTSDTTLYDIADIAGTIARLPDLDEETLVELFCNGIHPSEILNYHTEIPFAYFLELHSKDYRMLI